MGNVELRHIRLAERCVERPYNRGSVDRAAKIIAEAMGAPSTVDRALFDEMVEALQWFVDNDDTMEGDDPMPEKGNLSWDEINAFWLAGLNRARAVLAKAREAGK